jgi:8-oxo-dGTP pyrophosphatase MutT (NUDIX family)
VEAVDDRRRETAMPTVYYGDEAGRGDEAVSETREQISSGGVVVRQAADLEVCLINPIGRRVWGLPKGGVEPGESREEAALREVREETGIEAEVDAELGSIDYWFYSRESHTRIHKTVHYFLMRASGGDVSDHDHEVSEARWLAVSKALDLMSYPNEREIVRKAVALTTASQEPSS